MKCEGDVFDSKYAGVGISEIVTFFHESSRSGLRGRADSTRKLVL